MYLNIPLIVQTEWLAERLHDPKLRLIDATTYIPKPGASLSGRKTYEEGHIEGAVFADLLHELSDQDSPHPFTVPSHAHFAEKVSELGIGDHDTYVVIYDQGVLPNSSIPVAYWASRLAWQLRYEGYDRVAIMDGGLAKWKEEGRPVTVETGSYPKAEFAGEPRPDMIVTKDEVKKAMNDDQTVLINSLSPEDFRGETDTYPRKGHIPGSVNVFFGDHSDQETKTLRNEDDLRKTFEEAGALDPDKKVITYCGGGIAATWNALLLNKLGQKNVAVYDGSMNEWASDPTCPLIMGEE